MTREQVIELMESSQSAAQWDANCDTIKTNLGGYPDYWYEAILASGLATRVLARFGESDIPQVMVYPND